MESSALKPVGTGGMGPYGTFDMAGNAREWCWNAVGAQRHILGGAWSDPPWIFADRFSAEPFDRSIANGLRLVKTLDDTNGVALRAPSPRGERDYQKERPVSDAEFRTFAPLYDYDRVPLNVRVESVDSSNADWVRQTVTFDAAYGGERVIAHVVVPRHGHPPYQAVVMGAGGNAFGRGSSETMTQSLPFVVSSGRAVLYPVLRNMYERTDDRVNFGTGAIHNMTGELLGPNTYRDQMIMMMKDLRRSVDYLASRSDIDTTKIAYLGTSWGGRVGPIALAIEPRFRLGVLQLPGLMTAPRRPEADEFNFLPRVKVPTLMLSGKYDDIFPLDRTSTPFFRLLGTPPEHKRRVVYPTQHFVPRDQQIAETLNWLDRTSDIMGMSAAETNWTVEMLDALPEDGQRYEIIDGELFVTPAPSDVHQLVAGEFWQRLRGYLRPSNVARAIMSPADVRRSDRRHNRVQPDVFAVRLRDGRRPEYPYDLSDLLLAIEVTSTSNPLYDYQVKRELYLSNGVPEYWIVNVDARLVSRWRSVEDPGEEFSRAIAWHPAGMAHALSIDLPHLFEDALG